MTFTYDPLTDVGRIRRTIPDRAQVGAFWTDEELASFLADEGDWRRATALALETMASDAAFVLQVIRVNALHTDGASVARALMQRATTLRVQASDAEDNNGEAFDVIEMVPNEFAFRERLWNQAIRELN